MFQIVDTQQAALGYGSLAGWFATDAAILAAAMAGTYVQSGCAVSVGTNPGTLAVAAGVVSVNAVAVAVTATDNIACNTNVDATQDRWAFIEVNSSGVISLNVGSLGGLFPEPPALTANTCCLSAQYLKHGQSGSGSVDATLSSSNGATKIVDKRVPNPAGLNVQLFTGAGTYTWIKPGDAKQVMAICIGPGGGGGSGQRVSAVTTAGGGGGGGPGGVSLDWMPAAILGATESVVLGAGGAGGAAKATNAAGNAGSDGSGNTSFGAHANCIAGPGTAGLGGTAAGGAGGNAGTGNLVGLGTASATGTPSAGVTFSLNSRGGGNGANGTGSGAATAGSSDLIGPGGGGGGGGQNTGLLAAKLGGAGRLVGGFGGATLGGVAGTGNGGNGANGSGQAANFLNMIIGGGGGGGGAGVNTINTAGGNGGNGGAFGGGGGGGGNGVSTGSSGAGGNGADGAVLVLSFS